MMARPCALSVSWTSAPRHTERGRQAEQQGRQPGQAGGVQQYPAVDAQVEPGAGALAQQDVDAAGQHVARPQPQRGANGRQQQAFDQVLPHQPPSARAKGQAHGRFALPPDGARQQQIRDVGTDDEQHQADQEQQHPQRAAFVGADRIESPPRRRGHQRRGPAGRQGHALGDDQPLKLLRQLPPRVCFGIGAWPQPARSAGPTSTWRPRRAGLVSPGDARQRHPRGQRREDVHPLADGDAEEALAARRRRPS